MFRLNQAILALVGAALAAPGLAADPEKITVAYFAEWPTANQVAQAEKWYDEELGVPFEWRAFETGVEIATMPAISAATAADSISADLPRDRVKALAAVTETGGAYLRVEDDHILRSIPRIAAGMTTACT